MNGTLGKWLYDTFEMRFVFTKSGAALATAVMTFPLMVRAIESRWKASTKASKPQPELSAQPHWIDSQRSRCH